MLLLISSTTVVRRRDVFLVLFSVSEQNVARTFP